MKKIFNWTLWDWKSIRIFFVLTVVMSVGVYFFFSFPDYLRNRKSSDTNRETIGTFIKSDKIEMLSQGRTGNRMVTTGLTVEYSYIVDGVTYYAKDKIPNSFENLPFLKSLSGKLNNGLRIKYNSS